MELNFSQLRAFHAVAEAGSVGRGAEALMVSQPAVSKHLKLLERSLGTMLFERTAKGVRLTTSGELLADYAGRIFALADEACQAMDDLQGLRRGRLAIGASPTIGTHLLPEVLVRFRSRFPGVALSLEIESGQGLQRQLSEGKLDFGLSEVAPVREDIDGKPFMRDRLIAVASRGHALARKRGILLRHLCEYPFVVRETGSTTKSLVERLLAGRNLRVQPVLSVGSTEAIKRAVAAGLGVAIISKLSAAQDVAARRLVELRITDLKLSRPLYHLRLRGRRESKAAAAFLCLLHHAAASP
jgi:DNA-binding transcriptional LysR family regulator